MSNNTEIIIREETAHKLKLSDAPRFHRNLQNAIKVFCAYPFREAIFALFTLLYEEDKYPINGVLMKLNFTLYSEVSFRADRDYLFIGKDAVIPIAEELQFQYIKMHPSFLKLHNYTQCEKEFEALKNAMEAHPILLNRAVNSVWHCHEDTENVKNCIPLLLSENVVSQSKGLEKLGNSSKYIPLLVPYSKEIADFLKALNANFNESQQKSVKEQQKNHQAQNESHENPLVIAARNEINSPFSSLSTILDKVPANPKTAEKAAHFEGNESSYFQDKPIPSKPSDVEETSSFSQFSKFLDNKDKFKFSIPNADEFLEKMTDLRALGIDLNFMVDNLSTILQILSASEEVENTHTALLNAEKEHDEAISNYSKSNRETLHVLCTAGKKLTDAQNAYSIASVKFANLRNTFENVVV